MGTHGTLAYGINATGQIVGYYEDDGTAFGLDHGFLYSGGNYTTLDDPSANAGTFAQGINDSGQIVGYYTNTASGNHGFLYNPAGGGTYTTLDDPFAAGPGGTFAAATLPWTIPSAPKALLQRGSTTRVRSLAGTSTVAVITTASS